MKTKLDRYNFSLLFITLLSTHTVVLSKIVDTLNTTQVLRDGDTLLSSDGIFVLGFFSPGNSRNRYVGIWYGNINPQTVVWVANRETPVTNTSGVLKVLTPGIFVLVNETNDIVWSTNNKTSSSATVQNPIAQLLDSGNLVVADNEYPSNFLWQSFDYPTDTLIPGMKLGWNLTARQEFYLSSWKSDDDPSPGDYTTHIDPTGYPQGYTKRGEVEMSRLGPWNGLIFSGNLRRSTIYSFELVMNDKEVYYHNEVQNSSIITRLRLSLSGVAQRWVWVNRTQGWVIYLTNPVDNCDTYGLCGAYGSCDVDNTPICGCLSNKFVPRDADGWARADWSNGCVRRTTLSCQAGDGFVKYSGIKLPDAKRSLFNRSMNLEECMGWCLNNCSCMAYSSLDIRGPSGCLLWFDELVDIKVMSADGQDLYVRMALSESINISAQSKGRKQKTIIIVSLLLVVVIVLIGLSLILYYYRKKKIVRRHLRKRGMVRLNTIVNSPYNQSHTKESELPLFDLRTLTKATDNFSFNNILGEGGFGPVYKGLLEEGQEIAVKRLSSTSLQGVDEFENEVICIAKLQHRNLVKLLGYCIEGEENMLVYEYMTNKSLELILFDPAKSTLLDWPKRFNIINCIARGLLYLHQDSRLRIIHRDLKASNILLDSEMNPKISDFGLAKSFGGNETGANTRRVVGTYGYMSPEYAVDGLFSVKSDVFSFGVLVLEIVSGKKNRGFCHRDHNLNLLGHAWMLYKEGRSSELVGFNLENPCYLSEALRSIHVGLLCVQQCCEDRPNMSSVVVMLSNDSILPESKQPGFFTGRDIIKSNSGTPVSSNTTISTNEMSVTLLQPR